MKLLFLFPGGEAWECLEHVQGMARLYWLIGLELLSDQITSSISWNVTLDKLFQAFGGGKSENRSVCGLDLFLLRDLLDLKDRGISISTTEQTSRDEISSGLSPCQATWPKAHQSFKTAMKFLCGTSYRISHIKCMLETWNLHLFKSVYEIWSQEGIWGGKMMDRYFLRKLIYQCV